MTDQTTLEQKREEARAHRGVTYDDRIDKFTATIMVQGARRHLGSFTTAREAGLVYLEARQAEPIERRRAGAVGTVKKLLAEFAATAERDGGKIVPGQIFTTPDQQRFRFEGVEMKGKRNTFAWSSRCRICGALFDQNSVNSFRSITGFNRTCEAHRGQLGRMESHDWPDPPEWGQPPAPKALVSSRAVGGSKKAGDPLREGLPAWVPDIWGPKTLAFTRAYLAEHPHASQEAVMDAYALSTMPPELQARDYGRSSSARDEDLELLARSDTTNNNEDLA